MALPLGWIAAALLAGGAAAQQYGMRKNKKAADEITSLALGEKEDLIDDRIREIRKNANEYGPDEYGNLLNKYQKQGEGEINALNSGQPDDPVYAGDQSDAALKEAVRGEVYRANNARKVAKLYSGVQSLGQVGNDMGRQSRDDSARLSRYAPMSRYIDLQMQKDLVENDAGEKWQTYGQIASKIGQAMMLYSGFAGGPSAGAGEISMNQLGNVAGNTAQMTGDQAMQNVYKQRLLQGMMTG